MTPGPDSPPPFGTDVLRHWLNGLRILHVAHNVAGERHAKLARISGVGVAVLTSIVGTALFVSAAASENPMMSASAAALSLLAATLGVAQVALNYPDLAVRHRQAAVEYGSLRRELEVLLLMSKGTPPEAEISRIGGQWTKIEEKAPAIGARLRNRAHRMIRTADAARRAEVLHVDIRGTESRPAVAPGP
jgi:hypothetical protein